MGIFPGKEKERMENTRKVAVWRMVPLRGNLGKDRGFAIWHQPMSCSGEFPPISGHMQALRKLCHFMWAHSSTKATTYVDKGRKFNLHRNQVTCWAKKPSVMVYLQPFSPPSHANTWTGWHAGASGHEISTTQGTLHHKAGMNLSLNLCMVTQLPWAHTEVFLLPFCPVQ